MRGRRPGTGRRVGLPLVLLVALAVVAAVVLRRRVAVGQGHWLDGGYPAGTIGRPQPVETRSEPAQSTAPAEPPPAAAPAAPAEPAAPAAPAEPAQAADGLADLLALTRQELYALAQQRDIPGRSRMSKQELAEALAAHGPEGG